MCLVLWLTGSAGAGAQVLNFRHYTSGEGLPQAQVLALHQDDRGYLWFASYGGLSRFNGSDFRTFTTEDGLSSNSILDVTQDAQRRLIAGTSGGLCILEDGAFRCHRERDGLVYDDVRSVAAGLDGSIWAGTTRGLSRVTGSSIRNYTTRDGLPDDRVIRVAVDAAGDVWVATGSGLARLEGSRFVLDSPEVIGRSGIQFIAPWGRGLLVGTEGGRLYRRQRDAIVPVVAQGMPQGVVFVDGTAGPDSTIWLGTREGGLRISGGQVVRLRRQNGLANELVNRVVVDREGDVWFGTESGASKLVPGPFRTYTDQEGLPNPFVRAIAADAAGQLWVGTRNGVAVWEGERFRSRALPGIADRRVYGLAPAPGGGMLIATRQGLVWRTERGIRVFRERDGLPADVVNALLPDGRDGVWVGTDRGLARWEAGRVQRIDRTGLEGLNIISLSEDARGRLWLGRRTGGIAILDGDSIRFLDATNGATDQTIWALRPDAQDRMWAATNGDGALRIDDGGIRRFTMRDGLASNFIWQVLPDSRGDIWLFGNVGLDRLSEDQLTHYGRGGGLIELEGAANAAFMDGDGSLWFGTGAGIVRYVPGLDVYRAPPPPIYIEEASQREGRLPILPGGAVRLADGAIRIRFASPSFRDEASIRFRYRLIGADSAWSPASAERSINYAGLSPGSYRFQVTALNGGVQSAQPAVLEFEVLPTLLQTWWVRLLGLLLVGATAAAVPTIRSRSLDRERRRLEALVAYHTAELAGKNALLEQSNRDLEHFAYVASHDLQEPLRKIRAFSNRIATQYAARLDEQGRDYLGRMSGAAERMQNLIEALLTLSRVSTKKGESVPIDLDALVREVLGDLEFRLQSTRGRVDVAALPWIQGDPTQLRQLFQNLIGNALKFHRPDEAPLVRVSAVRRDGMVEIRVEDNGIGFDRREAERVFLPFHRLHSRAEYEGTGIGLSICRKIAERHDGSIRAESDQGQGSRFIVALPVHRLLEERHVA